MQDGFVEKLAYLKVKSKKNVAIGLYLESIFSAVLIYVMIASNPDASFDISISEIIGSGILLFGVAITAIVVLGPAIVASVFLYQYKKGLENSEEFPCINFKPKNDPLQNKKELVQQLNNEFASSEILYCNIDNCTDKNCDPKNYLYFRIFMLKSFFILSKNLSYDIYPVDKVLWAHLFTETTSGEGGGVYGYSNSYYLKIYCEKEVIKYQFRNKKEIFKYLEILKNNYHILTEYTSELNALHKVDFEEFKVFCENYKIHSSID